MGTANGCDVEIGTEAEMVARTAIETAVPMEAKAALMDMEAKALAGCPRNWPQH